MSRPILKKLEEKKEAANEIQVRESLKKADTIGELKLQKTASSIVVPSDKMPSPGLSPTRNPEPIHSSKTISFMSSV